MFDFDLFVIGGGSGGVRAARLAAEAGAAVALAEQSRMGGTCVIRGCVPKKLMVNAADFSDHFTDAPGFGWSVGETGFDWQRFRDAKDREILRLEQLYRSNLNRAGVKIFDQRAVLEDAHCVRLADGTRKSAKYVLIATGGFPYRPPVSGIEHAISSDDIFEVEALPERVLIVGGGYIACEFAGILNGMGCSVTQYYRGEQILRGFDLDIRQHVATAMKKRGIDLRLGADLECITKSAGRLAVTDKNGGTEEFDMVLAALGRRPNTEGLGLGTIGVELGPTGEVVVDAYSQSSVPSVFAVGDATDRINLTPVAIREGAAFAETIFNANRTVADHENVATAVFTRPEIGTVGLTEEAAARVTEVAVYRTEFRPLAAVLAGRDESVLMKLIVDCGNRRVLGVHIVGPVAGELIQLAAIAVKMQATKEDFDRTVAVHPTISEELVTMKTPVRITASPRPH
ncbi:MAG: glutathione-disulfide reductase [Rhodobacteraceae bacterium]|nr:glutathione-disulfide reductase [Paracoccaceae bacterium]